MDRAQLDAIRAQAETLLGESLGARGDPLTEIAAQRAMAYCGRGDIPPEMEQAVAALVCALAGGEAVKSLQRGDTAITYRDTSPLEALRPFCRLGTVQAVRP